MKTFPLHPEFGVEVQDVDLQEVTTSRLFPEIRDLFERHSLLLFRRQQVDHPTHLRLTELFGPIEDRSEGANGPDPIVSPVSNKADDGSVIDEEDRHILQLKSNQLWHTDSTFLPWPALVNILAAHVVPSSGGETEFVSTRAAFARLSEAEKEKLRNTFLVHRYAHSRRKISEEFARESMFTKWADQTWRAVHTNPVTGDEALYVASHVCAVDGLPEPEGVDWIERLIADATAPEHVYSHKWQVGDVLMFDERATLHRGQGWPYKEERTLISVVASSRDTDGVPSIRKAAA